MKRKEIGIGRKILFIISIFLLLPWSLATPVGAEEETVGAWETLPQEYVQWEEYLPDDVQDQLPDGLFSTSAEEVYAALRELTSFGGVLRIILQLLGLRLSEGITLLATLVGLILFSAVLRSTQKAIGGKGADLFGFCLRLAMFSTIVATAASLLKGVTDYFAQLQALSSAMVPVMGTLYALGGNLTQAVANQEILMVALAVCQYVGSSTVVPMCGLCLALGLLDAFRSTVRLEALAGLIKKWYTTFLGLLMTVLTAVLSAQSVLTARADDLQMKGVKYAVSNMLPVVGGAVSGTLGTVAAGVGVLRGVCGVCGVVLIALLLLPTLIRLLLYRAVFQMAGTAADMLQCDGEARLLKEVASLYGYVAAVAGICSVTFVVALAILVGGGAAVV